MCVGVGGGGVGGMSSKYQAEKNRKSSGEAIERDGM